MSSGARYRYPPVGYPLRLVNDGHTVGVTFPETYKGGIGLSSKATVHEMFQDAWATDDEEDQKEGRGSSSSIPIQKALALPTAVLIPAS